MDEQYEISIVICTYNRAAMLAPAIEGVLRQDTHGVRYEVIIVDNNSTDETRRVVEQIIKRGAENMRYVFEGKQGLSHARNAGVANARAPIIAFTDDDVRVQPDWVRKIKRTLDRHPEVDFIGGKVLPVWEREPPAWLTTTHWSPLALTDHGDTEFYVDRKRPWCLVGANLAVRRTVFDRIGLFSPEFTRIGVSSSEDHEFQMRVWHAGGQGLYAPEIVIYAEVQKERLTKEYHRRWWAGHGKSMALMRWYDLLSPEDCLLNKLPEGTPLYGVFAYQYRFLVNQTGKWLKTLLRGRGESEILQHEFIMRERYNYIRKGQELSATGRSRSGVAELGMLAKAVIRRKLRSPTVR